MDRQGGRFEAAADPRVVEIGVAVLLKAGQAGVNQGEKDVGAVSIDRLHLGRGYGRCRVSGDAVGDKADRPVSPFVDVGAAVDVERDERLGGDEGDCAAVGRHPEALARVQRAADAVLGDAAAAAGDALEALVTVVVAKELHASPGSALRRRAKRGQGVGGQFTVGGRVGAGLEE